MNKNLIKQVFTKMAFLILFLLGQECGVFMRRITPWERDRHLGGDGHVPIANFSYHHPAILIAQGLCIPDHLCAWDLHIVL